MEKRNYGVQINLPSAQTFLMSEITAINPDINKSTIRNLVKKQVDNNILEVCGKQNGKVGRPQSVYRKRA